jgi:hypothetical protein
VPRELADYTPFGYLSNPSHVARTYADTYGGNLRSMPDRLGVEWAYPVGRDARARSGIAIETNSEGRTCRTWGEYQAVGMVCRHHTSLMLGYEWYLAGIRIEARFFLVDPEALALRLVATNTSPFAREVDVTVHHVSDGNPPGGHALAGGGSLGGRVGPGEVRNVVAVLSRDGSSRGETEIEAAYANAQSEDAAFARAAPTLEGDWPGHWREGLHHDLQTTRTLVQPAGGIFSDVWPTWMTAWPRVVLAEGTLDMLRLAYVDPGLAQRAVSTLFRDAPEPNVPCVFRGGEYNMVAADGSHCGTSPAWCLPFLNLQLLYLRTLDRDWLAQIFPCAAAYIEWWLDNRADPDGWLVYKCTWESGEDGNPRLDPTGSGDAVISNHVRPVELQATLAHAAGVMAFFATELGRDPARWSQLHEDYRERTRRLFDPSEGRYRDWLISEHAFQSNCPDRPYWGIDPCRYSAQSLTPLLVGLPLEPEEVWRHATPPWTLWPSWTWSIVESAAAAGLYAATGELAFEIVDHVYRATTRRDLTAYDRPMPGCPPEFWPEDWRSYGGSDAYGWGATTANLLIRHLFGIKESSATSGWVLDLTPAFPRSFLEPGSRYAMRGLNYRGRRFDLSYTVRGDRLVGSLEAEDAHRDFEVDNGGRFTVRVV